MRTLTRRESFNCRLRPDYGSAGTTAIQLPEVRFIGLFLAAALALVTQGARADQGDQLPGAMIPQFVDPLPLLDLDLSTPDGLKTVIAGTDEITLNMLEFAASIMPSTFVPQMDSRMLERGPSAIWWDPRPPRRARSRPTSAPSSWRRAVNPRRSDT